LEEEERQRRKREAEEERLRLEREAEEARINEEKRIIAIEALRPVMTELGYYADTLNSRRRARKAYMDYFTALRQKPSSKK
jgi:hypothetical protein